MTFETFLSTIKNKHNEIRPEKLIVYYMSVGGCFIRFAKSYYH